MTSKIDAGLELISSLGAIELKPIEIRDLLYNLISKDYNTIDKILEIAQKKKLSTGYYVVLKSHTYGPYGSSCIRKIYLDHLL